MKNILFFCLLINSLFGLEVNLHAKSAILINANNGKVLYSKNSSEVLFPASITKIATGLYALEKRKELSGEIKASLDALTCVTPRKKRALNSKPYWLETDGRMFGLRVGDEIPFLTLMHAMLVGSGNDAANVIASSFGSISQFMLEVNNYLKEIGCKNTHFFNPHGLHYLNHVTTAEDMALIAKKAFKNELFDQIISSLSYICPKTNKEVVQFNKLVKKNNPFYYPYAIWGKTGFHAKAGYTLVAVAKKEERPLIAVVLGCKTSEQRYEDVIKLFEKAFEETKCLKTLFRKEELFNKKIKGAQKEIKANLKESLVLEYYPSEDLPMKAFIHWDENLKLPIEKESRVGEIQIVTMDGDILQKGVIYSKEKVEPTLWHRIKAFF